jgi:predicted P-loop ATPase
MCKTYVDGSGHDESRWHYNGVNELGFQGKFVLKAEQEFKKKPRPIGTSYFEYPTRDGEKLARVVRIDYKDKDKDIKQQFWSGTSWIFKMPKDARSPIPIYHYKENQDAIERGERIFIVEGESTADALWALGIPATTTIGGSGSYRNYGTNYSNDLKGARLLLAPDRDANGLKYIANFERDFADQIEGYYLAGSEGLWSKPSGGMDIGDDIVDHGYTKEQILEKVIIPAKYKELTTSSANKSQPATNKPVQGKKGKQVLDDDTQDRYKHLASSLGIALILNDEGDIESKLIRLTLDLYNLVGDRLKLNLMTRDYEYLDKPIDLNNTKFWIAESLGSHATTEDCILAIHAIASRHAYHPVKQYLESLKGKIAVDFDILSNISGLFLGNPDPLANKMMAKTLIGAVARVMKPGTKVDTLTVLQGGQGFLKSTFLKVLGGADWFCDDIRDLENKDELAKLARYWIVELAEVDYLMGRKEVESFKRFLSTTADTYRPPYGRANIRHERTCALFATTNKSEFLTDPTGDRRYWVIEVGGEIDCDRVIQNRDLIWATALAAFERGDTWWLSKEEEQVRASSHTQYRESDPWGDAINEKFKGSLPTTNCEGGEWLTTNQIFDLLDIPTKDRSRASSNRVTKILKEWGFESKSMRIDGSVRKVWFRSTENVIFQNIENIKLQGYKATEPIESSPERQHLLLPNLLPNISDNGIGYSREEERDTPLLPNNYPPLHSPSNTVAQGKPAPRNDFDRGCNPVTLLPNISPTPKKREQLNFKIGDRVVNLQGQTGTILKFRTHTTPKGTKVPQALVSNLGHECKWCDTEILSAAEEEVS